MKNYFTLDEDFDSIIKRTLQAESSDIIINNIKLNTAGWTNIVYEVSSNQGDFFFRFPRDYFWERTIVKDYEFAKYIKGKTSYQTVDLQLKEDNGRYFSIHKKIHGTPLAEKMNTMSKDDIEKVSRQIADFMYQMHNLKYDKDAIFTIDNIGLDLNNFINELLELHVSEKDQLFWNTNNFKIENKSEYCLVHGDFNSSNVLLDDNNNVCAIIDFGFGGFGNKYMDISRIIGRCPESFKKPIISSYQNFESKGLSNSEVDKNIDIWNNIDSGYINYMRKIGIYK